MPRISPCLKCLSRPCLKNGVPCREVEALLPSPAAGRNMREWTNLRGVGRIADGPSRRALREASEGPRLLMLLSCRFRHLLTPRERAVAAFVWGMGCSLNEAAARMGVSRTSVRSYMRRTLVKMYGVIERAQKMETRVLRKTSNGWSALSSARSDTRAG